MRLEKEREGGLNSFECGVAYAPPKPGR
jgi:hypothetical protein